MHNNHKGRVWANECFLWCWLTHVILDKGLLNGLLLCYYFIHWLIFQVSLGLLVSPWALFQLFGTSED